MNILLRSNFKNKSSKWVVFEGTEPYLMPNSPGCYVIYLDGLLSYIGQSSNIRKRFQNYQIRQGYSSLIFTPWGQFESVITKVHFGDKYGDWAMRELRLIKRLQPQLNCVGSTKKRSNKNA